MTILLKHHEAVGNSDQKLPRHNQKSAAFSDYSCGSEKNVNIDNKVDLYTHSIDKRLNSGNAI